MENNEGVSRTCKIKTSQMTQNLSYGREKKKKKKISFAR